MMSQSTDPAQDLIVELRSAFETETTISRILGRSKESLERFLAHPASLDQIKQSLAKVLSRKAIPYGQPVDQDGYSSWKLYTDPTHLFCIRPTHQRSTTSRHPTIMVSLDGQSTEYSWARLSSKYTSAWTTAANRVELSCVRLRRSVNVRERSLLFQWAPARHHCSYGKLERGDTEP
jgi:hypothetical protein